MRTKSFTTGRMTVLLGPLVVAALAVWLGEAPLGAQQADDLEITGRVLDATTNAPVGGSFVHLFAVDSGTFSDSTGVFRLTVREAPTYHLIVENLGYADEEIAVSPGDLGLALDIRLEPDPIALEELEVVADRFHARRNAYAGSVWAFEQDVLVRSGASTAYDLVVRKTGVRPCPPSSLEEWCAWRRGRLTPVEVYIDERPTFLDGLEWLHEYAPEDLYLLEIYDRGSMVRAYTRAEVDGNPRRLMALSIVRLNPPGVGPEWGFQH